jgi:hypothetical protein
VPKVGTCLHHLGKSYNSHNLGLGFRVCLHLPGIQNNPNDQKGRRALLLGSPETRRCAV